MKRALQALIALVGLTLSVAVLGFILFAISATRVPPGMDRQSADGIVVLTGGDHRILEAARLLSEARGRRLLISGVNRVVGRDELIRITRLTPQMFDCCVDVGYDALDTIGNADETRNWAQQHGFGSLIVVTSSYHMPRSLAEISSEMPTTRLLAHPVVPKGFPTDAWWLKPAAVRRLLAEYVKFLPAAARHALAQLNTVWDSSSVAHSQPGRPARL